MLWSFQCSLRSWKVLKCSWIFISKFAGHPGNAKLYLCKTGQLDITENELNDHNIAINARLDGFWNTQGWSHRRRIIGTCFEPIGMVFTKFLHCKNCQYVSLSFLYISIVLLSFRILQKQLSRAYKLTLSVPESAFDFQVKN